jgi:hypothetical protein
LSGLLLLIWVVWVKFRWQVFTWNNGLPVLFVVKVICEQIILLSIDDCFNNLSGVVSFFSNHITNNFHYDSSRSRESHENAINDLACKELKLCINVLNQFKRWLSEFFELRLDQVVKNIN